MTAALIAALRNGDRRALARAITLVELTRPDHRSEAEELLNTVLAQTGDSIRIGISGPPGAGKSTFIERFGLDGIGRGRQYRGARRRPGIKTRRRRDPRRQDPHGRTGAKARGLYSAVFGRRQPRRRRAADPRGDPVVRGGGVRCGHRRDHRRRPGRNRGRRDRRHVRADPAAGGGGRIARESSAGSSSSPISSSSTRPTANSPKRRSARPPIMQARCG